MKKLTTIMLAFSLALLASCSSDDTATLINGNEIPELPAPRSYKILPCNVDPIILNMPNVPLYSLKFQIKRASGGNWVEYPVTAENRVFNNDSVWFQVTDPAMYLPDENNYLEYQIFNKDTVKSSTQNHFVRFQNYNAPVNQKLKVTFQEY